MKKWLSGLLCLFLLASVTGCAANSASSTNFASESAGVPNPLVVYDSVEEAQQALGFSCKVPGVLPAGYAQTLIQTIDNKVLEIEYENAGGDRLTYRTAQKNDDNTDISGDYNSYTQSSELEIGGLAVAAKGNATDLWNLATWVDGDMVYSIGTPAGISTEDLTGMIESL